MRLRRCLVATLLVGLASPGASEASDAHPSVAPSQVLADSQNASTAADKRATAAMEALLKFKEGIHSRNVTATADLIEAQVDKAAEKRRAAAEQDFKTKLAELDAMAPAAATGADTDTAQQLQALRSAKEETKHKAEAVRQAANELRQVTRQGREQMKNLVRNLRQADQKEARRLGRVAMNASNEALAAAKAVEKAQREDNVSKRRFEGEYGNYEDKYEDLHDRAQDTRDDIMDAIQNFYESVEEHMDSRADKREDEDARREEIRTQRSEERHKLQDM